MHATLLSVHAGQIATIPYGNGTKASAIAKPAVAGQVRVGLQGIEGDQQADRKHHGGPAQAICCYASEHYPYWQQRLGRPLPAAGFGENFLTAGVTEVNLCIGDMFRAGTALVQVTQPRGPCATLAAYLGVPKMAAWASENGLTGWYMSVVEPGVVSAGDSFILEERPGTGVTVMDVNMALHSKGGDKELAERVLAEELLLGKWRAKLAKLLAAA